MTSVNNDLKQLYEGYYEAAPPSLVHKRGLSAISTLQHLNEVSGGKRWGRLIDVGAGDGAVLTKLAETKTADEFYAVEISESGVDAIRAAAPASLKEVKVFDGYKIDYPDKFFDAAICIHVIEHVEHERILLRELARVAKEIIIEVPLEGGLRIAGSIVAGRLYGHINLYTLPGFLYLLETSGLKVEQYAVTTSSADYERHLYGAFKGTVKSAIRRTAVRLFPSIAPWFFACLLTVRCR